MCDLCEQHGVGAVDLNVCMLFYHMQSFGWPPSDISQECWQARRLHMRREDLLRVLDYFYQELKFGCIKASINSNVTCIETTELKRPGIRCR